MSAKADQVRDLTEQIRRIDLQKGQQEIVDLAKYYKAKYANWPEVDLFHPMIASTPWIPITQEDFPGSDSVLIQLEEIRQKLLQIMGGPAP